MTQLLSANPLVVVFLVIALGYLAGRLRVLGFSFGIAAVLFAGLFLGAFLPGLEVSELLLQLGLVLFVYTLGVASGPQFFENLRRRGKRDTAFVVLSLGLSVGVTLLVARLFSLTDTRTAGLFAGSLTNTPALAAVLEQLKQAGAPPDVRIDPVIAFSVVYPGGVLGVLLVISLAERWFLKNENSKDGSTGNEDSTPSKVVTSTIEISKRIATPLGSLPEFSTKSVTFTRLGRSGVVVVAREDTELLPGDLLTVVGEDHAVDALTQQLGRTASVPLEADRSDIDYRRILVSNPKITERPIKELALRETLDAAITRIRRGDHDFVATPDFKLELGDRIRVVAPKRRLAEVASYFGDSQRKVSEIDLICFGLGIALGLLLGVVPIPVGNITEFRFGFAGGPLIVGLLLGRLGRTGPLVWSLPGSANLTLRQLGLSLFLASVGLRAGQSFAKVLAKESIVPLFCAGLATSVVSMLGALLLGHYVFKLPTKILVGTLSGLQTQPAALAFATERLDSDAPNHGYTSVFPTATILKILLAQTILLLL